MRKFWVLLPHMLEVDNFCGSIEEEREDRKTLSSWMYRFLDAVPELEECELRLERSLEIMAGASEYAHRDELTKGIEPVVLHKIWHESVLGLDVLTRQPIQYTRADDS